MLKVYLLLGKSQVWPNDAIDFVQEVVNSSSFKGRNGPGLSLCSNQKCDQQNCHKTDLFADIFQAH